MSKLLLPAFLLLTSLCTANDTVNVMFYNIYRFPEKPPANREFILKDIVNEFQPDLFMVCELISESGAERILNSALQNGSYDFKMAPFVPTLSDTGDPLHQTVFYNKRKLMLVQQYTYPTLVRDINRYTFVLNALDLQADSVLVDVFVTHLKSSEGPENEALRLTMADTFVRVLQSLPPDRHVLLAGDFNFYSSAEAAYQRLTDPANNIVMTDPINSPGEWHNNPAFAGVHTQATRTSAEGFGTGGATGGMDDRFDFVLISDGLRNNELLRYVEHSYHAFGNNGNCFDQRIDAYDCDGSYDLPLRRKLHNMSDHAPVVLQLHTNKQFLGIAANDRNPKIAIAGSNVVHDILEIKINQPVPGLVLKVCNNLGQTLKSRKIQSGEKKVAFAVDDLVPGLYYLRLVAAHTETLKFIRR